MKRGKSRQFLWVNKDEASISLSKSDRAESHRIFQFVQQRRNDEPDTRPEASRQPYAHVSDRRDLIRGSKLRPRKIKLQKTRKDRTRSTTSSHSSDSELSSVSSHTTNSVETWFGLYCNNFTPSSSVDPFSSTCLPISRQVEVLLKYYWTIVARDHQVDKTEVLPRHVQPIKRTHSLRDEYVRGTLQDRIRFSSLLAVLSARMVHISRISPASTARPEIHIQFALETLREHLIALQSVGETADRVIVDAISSLSSAEWMCQRFDSAIIHLRAVKQLLPVLDMSNKVDWFAVKGIANVDRMVAIETGCVPVMPPMFDPGPYPDEKMAAIHEKLRDLDLPPPPSSPSYKLQPTPLKPALMQDIDILADAHLTMDSRLGSSFTPFLSHRHSIHPLLAAILKRMISVVTVAKLVWRTPHATRPDAEWMCQRARFVNYQLLALPSSLPPRATGLWANKTEALRITLVLVMLRATNSMASRTAQPNARRLKAVLCTHPQLSTHWSTSQNHDPPHSHRTRTTEELPADSLDENGLLLFILLTGHFAALGEPEDEWFLLRAASVGQKLGMKAYEELHEHMTGYFYSWTRQEGSLRVVALHL